MPAFVENPELYFRIDANGAEELSSWVAGSKTNTHNEKEKVPKSTFEWVRHWSNLSEKSLYE